MSISNGWKTYNFEVADHHTYIADGTRVHNDSKAFLDGVNNGYYGYHVRKGYLDLKNDIDNGVITEAEAHALGKTMLQGLLARGAPINIDGGQGSGDFYEFIRDFFPDGFSEFGAVMSQGSDSNSRDILISVDIQGDGDPSNDVWENLSTGEFTETTGRGHDRTVAQEKQAQDNLNFVKEALGIAPVILDLDGDGIEFTPAATYFDVDDDGFKEETAWVAPDDGFLVIDTNGDNKITKTEELVLSYHGNFGDTDLEALKRAYDQNNDGKLTNQDAIWSDLRVWQDANSNGVTDSGELKSLQSLNITEIGLLYDNGKAYSDTSDDVAIFDSALLGSASFKQNGVVRQGGVGDVIFSFAHNGYKTVDTNPGFKTIYEDGTEKSYRVISEQDAANWTVGTFDGVVGDIRDNRIDGTSSEKSLLIDGASGNDTLLGSVNADALAGGFGADQIQAKGGADIAAGGKGSDVVRGGAGNDAVFGDEGDDFVYGGFGDDLVEGGDGNDTLFGGEEDDGSDAMFGGEGDDIVFGGSGRDQLFGGDGFDDLNGGAWQDQIYGGKGYDILRGGSGDDTLHGGRGGDDLFGGHGADKFLYLEGEGNQFDWIKGFNAREDFIDLSFMENTEVNLFQVNGSTYLLADTVLIRMNNTSVGQISTENVLLGDGSTIQLGQIKIGTDSEDDLQFDDHGIVVFAGAGNDNVVTTDGSQIIFAEDGDDSISSGSGRDIVYGGSGSDVVYAGSGHDNLYGGSGNDLLKAGNGNDKMYGNSGNDNVQGGYGDDLVYGGSGDDRVHGSQGSDSLFGGDGNDLIKGGQDDTGADTIFGGDGDDIAEGGSGRDELFGGAGSDVLDGGAWLDTIFGGTGNDDIIGDTGDDILNGDEGRDTVYGGYGNDKIDGGVDGDWLYGGSGLDVIHGGHGWDKIYGGEDSDDLYGGAGTDTIEGGLGADTISGGIGNDIVDGGSGRDELFGGAGSDVLDGGAWLDTIFGGTGNDDIIGDTGDDILNGDEGRDTVYGGYGNDKIDGGVDGDWLYGGSGLDVIHGGHGWDKIYGGEDSDDLYGGAGTDTIEGGAGADTIDGGSGDDVSFGGTGADVFVYDDSTGDNTIVDFSSIEGDKLDLSSIDAIGSWNDLKNNHLSQENGDTMIVVGNTKIRLSDVIFSDLTSADFIL